MSWRWGTTSYIVPAGLAENARFLAERGLNDMQLVLFDLPDGRSNLPDGATAAELRAIGEQNGLSYSVHLTQDLGVGEPGGARNPSLAAARQVIARTAPILPQAYVLHLDGMQVRELPPEAPARRRWEEQIVGVLDELAELTGGYDLLVVENVEGYPPGFLERVARERPFRRCVDVGHLWLDGHDPLPALAAAGERLEIVHLHGVHGGRDHQALSHTAQGELGRVFGQLAEQEFGGVVTLEVFEEPDFAGSLTAVAPWRVQ